jgi:hypothetical protein
MIASIFYSFYAVNYTAKLHRFIKTAVSQKAPQFSLFAQIVSLVNNLDVFLPKNSVI